MRPTLKSHPDQKKLGEKLLLEGLEHHRSGHTAQAALCYAAILDIDPRNADALHLTGVLALRRGDLAASERYIRRAIRENPSCGLFHQNLGCTLTAAERPVEAIESFRRAVELDQKDVKSLLLLGELLGSVGEVNESIPLLRRVIELDKQQPEAYSWLGAMLQRRGDTLEAIPVFREAVERFPDDWQAAFNLAGSLFEAKRWEEAVASYRRVIDLNPKYADAHNCLGRILHEFNDLEGARAAYLKAIELDPAHGDALSNLGAILLDQGELDLSRQMLEHALGINPGLLNAHSNLGTVLTRLGDVNGAVESLKAVLSHDPRHLSALCSMGFLHDTLGDEQGAIGYFSLALAVDPNSALALFNISSHLLAHGDLSRGWQAYERRWQVRQFYSKRKQMEQPQWRGEDIRGSRILLYSEQGFGDTFQFIRYVSMVSALGAEVILEVQKGVFNLLKDFPGAKRVVAAGSVTERIDFDWHCPLMSLPLAFGTTLESIPGTVPYLVARPDDVTNWARRIHSPQLRVGLVWSGNPEHTRDKLRSIPLTEFTSLLAVDGVTFYSLQKGGGAAQLTALPSAIQPINLDADLRDFTDTAAAIAHLDLVICVDTSVAHLAGALGKPVWILIPPAADWRWLRGRHDNPWYPTARLFRRVEGESWGPVMARMAAELKLLAASHNPHVWNGDQTALAVA